MKYEMKSERAAGAALSFTYTLVKIVKSIAKKS